VSQKALYVALRYQHIHKAARAAAFSMILREARH
jgi:hypothetical protein